MTVEGHLVSGPLTEFVYDEMGNLLRVIDALGNPIILTRRPDGLVETVTDRNGQITTFSIVAETIG